MIVLLLHKSARGGSHHQFQTVFDMKRPVLAVFIGAGRRVDDESAVETLARAELLAPDLMTDSAGYAIFGLSALLLIRLERQMRKNFAQLAFELRSIARHRHMAHRAFIFDLGLRAAVIDGLAAHAG